MKSFFSSPSHLHPLFPSSSTDSNSSNTNSNSNSNFNFNSNTNTNSNSNTNWNSNSNSNSNSYSNSNSNFNNKKNIDSEFPQSNNPKNSDRVFQKFSVNGNKYFYNGECILATVRIRSNEALVHSDSPSTPTSTSTSTSSIHANTITNINTNTNGSIQYYIPDGTGMLTFGSIEKIDEEKGIDVPQFIQKGIIYKGQWLKGMRDGSGCGLISSNCCTGYQGSYFPLWDIPDLNHQIFAVYKGSWKKGVLHGRGSLVDRFGNRIEGEWVNDQAWNAKGTVINPVGDLYRGEWSAGFFSGILHSIPRSSIVTFQAHFLQQQQQQQEQQQKQQEQSDEEKHDPEKDNEQNNEQQDVMSISSILDIMQLNWSKTTFFKQNNLLEGVNNTNLNGDTFFSGQIKNNKKHGFGKETDASGAVYSGFWKDDKRHFSGVFQWPSGKIEEREYNNDILISRSTETASISEKRIKELEKMLGLLTVKQREMENNVTQHEQFREILEKKHQQDEKIAELESKIATLQEDSSKLKVQLEEEHEKTICQICMDKSRNALIMPCCHFLYCDSCVKAHQKNSNSCPACRGNIVGVMVSRLAI